MTDPDQGHAPSRRSNRIASRSVPAGRAEAARAVSASRSPPTRALDIARAASAPAPPSAFRSPPSRTPVAARAVPLAARNAPIPASSRLPAGLPAATSLTSRDVDAQNLAAAKVLSSLPSPQSPTAHAAGPGGLPFTVPRRSRYRSPQTTTAPVQIPTSKIALRQSNTPANRYPQIGSLSSSGRREDGIAQSPTILPQADRASTIPPAPLVRSRTAPQSSIIYRPQPRYQYQMSDEFLQQIGALASSAPSGLATDQIKPSSEKRKSPEPSRAFVRLPERSLGKGADSPLNEGLTPELDSIVDASSLHSRGSGAITDQDSGALDEAMLRNRQADLDCVSEKLGKIQQGLTNLEDPLHRRFQASRDLGMQAQEEINKKISSDVANANQLKQANRPVVATAGRMEDPRGGGSKDHGSEAGTSRLVALRPPGPRADEIKAGVSQGLKYDSDAALRRQDWAVAKLGPEYRGHHSEQVIAQVLCWKERNESVQAISEQTGVPIGTIYNWWRQCRPPILLGQPLERSIIPLHIIDRLDNERGHRNIKFDSKVVAQVLIWKAEGESTRTICAETGLVEVSVNKWWRTYRHRIFGGPAPGAEAMQE